MSKLSTRLIELQEKNNFLKKDVAEKVNISVMAYYRYETANRMPTVEILTKFADLYNVSLDYLTGRTDNPEINK